MTANDTATRRVTTGIVLAVGLFAGSELARRRHSRESGLLAEAEHAFPAAGAGNVPSLREIQRAMRIGQGKAQQVQAHFVGLQAHSLSEGTAT